MPVTPKVEQSPPHSYEPQRQTVLMWGASNQNSSVSTRSPNTTPTSNEIYNDTNHHLKLSNHIVMSPSTDEQHHTHNSHLKWNGTNKHIMSQSYSLNQHHEVSGVGYSEVEQQPITHHVGGHIVSTEHLHQSPQSQLEVVHSINQQTQAVGSSCEVWSPASYSQYQYFTYHHAPQHASTQ